MCFHVIPHGTQKGFETIAFNDNQEKQTSPSVSRAVCFQMLSYHATCSKVEVDRLKVTPMGWCSENSKPSLTCTVLPLLLVWRTDASSPPLKAAKIPLGIELGIDEFHFNDFSLDNDAMITASLRMFLDLGAVQKFKIDYEVRRVVWNAKKKKNYFCAPCNTWMMVSLKVLCRWLLTVRKNYRTVAYHNWRHAFNVSQCMFVMITVSGKWALKVSF